MPTRVTVVDAFADAPFTGNPAAVCVLDDARPEGWMQRVAREMNHSETAFVHREGAAWRLRWFTPLSEVDLCGHATLATAHVLWQNGLLAEEEGARFLTRSGALGAVRAGEWIELDFPALPPREAAIPAELAAALGAEPRWVGRSRFDLLVLLDTDETVRNLRPDMGLLRRLDARGVIVTSRAAGPPYDFVSRFFGPAVGVDEDPVTGSAHCTLAPFWAERLGRSELLGYQASRRGGTVRVRAAGERIALGGRAVTMLEGTLLYDHA